MLTNDRNDGERGIETIAWYWLWSGVLCLLCVPAARAYSPAVGWYAYWLVGAPMVWLGYVFWPRFAARCGAFLVRSSPARRGFGDTRQGRQHNRRQGRRLAVSRF